MCEINILGIIFMKFELYEFFKRFMAKNYVQRIRGQITKSFP